MRMLAKLTLALALVGGTGAIAPTAQAAAGYERGPNPTSSALEATRGPFGIASTTVSSLSADGFGGGTIYYPTDTSQGTFGGVIIAPGYTASRSTMAWLAERLASHGFVVFNIDTNSRYDQPDSRGRQILAAADHLAEESSSTVRSRLDASRIGVMGHSMGGGGTLAAADSRPSLQAAVPLTPWHTDKTWGDVQVPTMIIGAENDSIAPVGSHSEPFYASLSAAPEKAYLELNGASHFAPNSDNDTIAKYGISWMKRFVDDDLRYDQFLCPPPARSTTVEEYRSSCPHS
ncbi:dienelactone hydrolase family protein [Planomonospora sp. ID67723]|uniref:alpha/beta hydrolase family protein n=1 Tax=Planomonospora sp. ID67723 TaxID=2738134 RepID=UPI0018C406E1|nr:dienelactone hydrolase family protein [Planomonospora sp. ID67723]MBG0833179.1 dienelactone hydrolase family protein [Planomonospora sp. ID67723]